MTALAFGIVDLCLCPRLCFAYGLFCCLFDRKKKNVPWCVPDTRIGSTIEQTRLHLALAGELLDLLLVLICIFPHCSCIWSTIACTSLSRIQVCIAQRAPQVKHLNLLVFVCIFSHSSYIWSNIACSDLSKMLNDTAWRCIYCFTSSHANVFSMLWWRPFWTLGFATCCLSCK